MTTRQAGTGQPVRRARQRAPVTEDATAAQSAQTYPSTPPGVMRKMRLREPEVIHVEDDPPTQDEEETEEEEEERHTRPGRSTINYRYRQEYAAEPTTEYGVDSRGRRIVFHEGPPPPRRASLREAPRQERPAPPRRSRLAVFRTHWLLILGLSLLTMILGYYAISALGAWWQVSMDDLHYGRPRTYQTDAVVGHGDSPDHPSHFIAMNLSRHIQITEYPGGDPSKAKIYMGPTLIGDGSELSAVTISFKDVNGDGKPDMIISVGNERYVFINENGAFRALKPGENINLP